MGTTISYRDLQYEVDNKVLYCIEVQYRCVMACYIVGLFSPVYVYIGHRNLLGEMMTAMAMAGVFQSNKSRREYLLLFIEQEEYIPNAWHEYLWGEQLLCTVVDI